MSSLWPNHLLGQANLHLLRSPSMILSTATIFKIQPSHWISGILIYEIPLIHWLGFILKIVAVSAIPTPPYFCWQLAFHRHLPTSGRQNRVKNLLYPPFIYIFWILSASGFCRYLPWKNLLLKILGYGAINEMFCFSLISFAASQKTSFPSSWCPALFTLFVLSKVTAEKT